MDNIVVKFELKIAMGYFLLKMYNCCFFFRIYIINKTPLAHQLDTVSRMICVFSLESNKRAMSSAFNKISKLMSLTFILVPISLTSFERSLMSRAKRVGPCQTPTVEENLSVHQSLTLTHKTVFPYLNFLEL